MSKKQLGRQLQLQARELLQQSKLALQLAMLESEPAQRSAALERAKSLAETAEARSNKAVAAVR